MRRTEMEVLSGSGILPHLHWSLELNQDENPKLRVSSYQSLSLNSILPTQEDRTPLLGNVFWNGLGVLGPTADPVIGQFQSYCFN